jgi:hypothetical protein
MPRTWSATNPIMGMTITTAMFCADFTSLALEDPGTPSTKASSDTSGESSKSDIHYREFITVPMSDPFLIRTVSARKTPVQTKLITALMVLAISFLLEIANSLITAINFCYS